jgi:hypothetical protein
MIIVMTKLVRLEYRVNEDLHTLAYKRDIEQWMKQWTVANNFSPICHVYDDSSRPATKEDYAPMVEAAKDALVARHVAILKKVFPEHTKIERNYAEDFRFAFEVSAAPPGVPLKHVPFM